MNMPPEPLLIRVRDALAWRLHRLLGDRLVYGSLLAAARLWRRAMRRPVFVAVTGSAGKTTTKELLLGMLARSGAGVGNFSSFSNIEEIAKAMLRLRPSHRVFVTELSGHNPGEMDRPLALLRPSIGIVTVVGDDHTRASYPREAIAREKGKLIAALPVHGSAVLNADDPLVLAMAQQCRAAVITYGLSAQADLRAQDIRSVWPDRLRMTLLYGQEHVPLQTQLCGTHWIPAVLGAIGAGLAMGMSLRACAEGLASVVPFDGRMQPVASVGGVTFIRDDWKAPLWTLDASLDFMRQAQAHRKIIVLGEVSDAGPSKGVAYARLAQRTQDIAEITILVGHWAASALKARRAGRDDAVLAFSNVRDASAHLDTILREGDLVLLKGTNRQDHLLRMILARQGAVACWRDDCKRYQFCNECPDLGKPSGAPLLLTPTTARDRAPGDALAPLAAHAQVIVGLGNPEPGYAHTPHNLGYDLVDQLALAWGLTWRDAPDAWIAQGLHLGRTVCLVKVRLAMNGTGAGLKRLADCLRFGPAQVILLYDDLALPLGTVRTRLSGGSGGHRGVASVLQAFQTDAFRRVKLGIGPVPAELPAHEYVLTAWDSARRPSVEQAVQVGTSRVAELLASLPRGNAAHTGAQADTDSNPPEPTVP